MNIYSKNMRKIVRQILENHLQNVYMFCFSFYNYVQNNFWCSSVFLLNFVSCTKILKETKDSQLPEFELFFIIFNKRFCKDLFVINFSAVKLRLSRDKFRRLWDNTARVIYWFVYSSIKFCQFVSIPLYFLKSTDRTFWGKKLYNQYNFLTDTYLQRALRHSGS